ncbi:hypothetical protein [Qipengyuania sp. MTN3-11]|uniref:hypothetical protein n=1 Tax=Qipengyuania sp. MTN3-11 TaxID=3056557 RepID=UPI0036F24128
MSLRPSFLPLAVAIASFGVPTPAFAECRLTIEPAQDDWAVRYDPYAQDVAIRQFDVAFYNGGDTPCEGTVSADLQGEQYGLSKIGGGERIAYALTDERNGTDITPLAGSGMRRPQDRPVSIAPGERLLIRFSFMPDTFSNMSAGNYVQNILLAVEDAFGAAIGQRPIVLSFDVVPTALIGLKGRFQRSGGAASIDLGELTPGQKSLGTSLYVLSTSGYRVTMSSQNAGRLRLGQSDWYVDYSLGLDNEQYDLSAASVLAQPSQSARADDYDLDVVIGDVAGRRAGAYSDTIVFTVAAM